MDEKVSNHPCHRLSIPSAKLFWCRHCMQSFEDPINRWRHSKTCKTGGPSNHDKRLEQEPFALQTYCETKQREGAVQSAQLFDEVTGEELVIIKQETVDNEPKAEYSCFICKRPFNSLDDMKEHVKYPCSKNDSYDYPIYIPGSGGTYVEAPGNYFPNSGRKMTEPEKPKVISRQPVIGEIIEQSADPDTGIRTFEVHSQNDDIPLSDILSKLSEGGYLVAGEEESAVNQVVVVQQVDEQGQITQTEHILPPHIQIQNQTSETEFSEVERIEEVQDEVITYYITESGELMEPVPIKHAPKNDSYYGNFELSGINILTQAAEATMGNLIYPEKRKYDDEEEDEKNVKRSRNQCRPDDDTPNQDPPHSPRSPQPPPDGASWNSATETVYVQKVQENASQPQTGNGSENGKQQQLITDGTDNENLVETVHTSDVFMNITQKVEENSSKYTVDKLQTTEPDIKNKENLTKDPKISADKNKKVLKRKHSCSDEEFKCRICDKVFKTTQLLHRHSQYPCKVFNTRHMCQKTLRPNRGVVVVKQFEVKRRTTTKNNTTSSKPKSNAQICRKPMSLLGGRRVFSTLVSDRKLKHKIKKKIVYIPTPPRIKTIWLPEKDRLVVNTLEENEQFFYELDLVCCRHLADTSYVKPSIENTFATLLKSSNIEKLESVFTPLLISTDMECMRNCDILNTFSPPVLQRMDIPSTSSLDDQDFTEEPPVLIPILDIKDKEKNRKPVDNGEIMEPLLENDYQYLDFSELSSPDYKSTENRRHFMDLFIEASPATATKEDDSQESREEKHYSSLRICQSNTLIEKKAIKEIILKEDVISKLTEDLKKKFSPQNTVDIKVEFETHAVLQDVKLLQNAKRHLLSSFTTNPDRQMNIKQFVSDNANPNRNIVRGQEGQFKIRNFQKLVLPISKVKSGLKSPSKINVMILKHKSKSNDSPTSLYFNDSVFQFEDDICEILDQMLTEVSKDSISRIQKENEPIVLPFCKTFDEGIRIISNTEIMQTTEKEIITVYDILDEMVTEICSQTKYPTEEKIKPRITVWETTHQILAEIPKKMETPAEKINLTESKTFQTNQEFNNQVRKTPDQFLNDISNQISDIICVGDDYKVHNVVVEMLDDIIDKIESEPFNRRTLETDINRTFKTHKTLELSNNLTTDTISSNDKLLVHQYKNSVYINNDSPPLNNQSYINNVHCSKYEVNSFLHKERDVDVPVDVDDDRIDSSPEPIISFPSFHDMSDPSLFGPLDIPKPIVQHKFPSSLSNNSTNYVPEMLKFLITNKNNTDSLKSENNLKIKSRICTLPQFLDDEGIVSDITEDMKSQSTNEMWNKEEEFESEKFVRRPKVTVQYIDQLDSLCDLTSHSLHYGINDRTGSSIDCGSRRDFPVNKIRLCEEEIVLSDSGLDDSDEIISQNSVENDLSLTC